MTRRRATWMWIASSRAPMRPSRPRSKWADFQFIINMKTARTMGLDLPLPG